MSDCAQSIWDSNDPANPVHRHGDGSWWFYEETWADENGPYDTKEECEMMLAKYCREVLG